MNATDEWARSEILNALKMALPSESFCWPTLAERFGFDLQALAEPDGVVPFRATTAVFEHVAEVLQDDAALFDIFHEMNLGKFTLYDYLFVCAPTLRDGCLAWKRFLAMRTNCVSLTFTEDDSTGTLEWIIPPRLGNYTQNMFARIGWSVKRVETALDQSPAPVRIELIANAPSKTSRLQERYGDRIQFGQSRNCLVFSKEVLSQAPKRNDENLYSIIQKAAGEEQASFAQRGSPLCRIADEISETMKTGTCSLQTVASNLGISQRSIQRLLAEEGTSFRQMTEEIRRSAAGRYLRETNLPMKEIAFLLGFSEISTFSRAVKSWYGQPPKEIRRTVSGG